MSAHDMFSGRNKKAIYLIPFVSGALCFSFIIMMFAFKPMPFHGPYKCYIAPGKVLFFQSKSTDRFLISPQKHMLWVLIGSHENICCGCSLEAPH